MIDAGPPPIIFPKPAIIRSAADLNRHDRRAIERRFGVRFRDPALAMLPGAFPFVGAGGAPIPSGGYVTGGYYEKTSGSATMTFTGVDIGTASATRTIVITAGARFATATGATCTVNGVTIDRQVASAITSPAAIYSGIVATGSTGVSVVLSGWTSTSGGAGIGVYAVYDLLSSTAEYTNYQDASDAALSVTVSDGGFIVGTGRGGNSSSGWVWTNLTEDYDQLTASGSQSSLSGASDWFVTGGSQSITMNYSGGTKTGGCLAAFR